MDPTASVVAALAPYLAKAADEFAKEFGKAAANKLGALYEAIKARFRSQAEASAALENVEKTPQDEQAQSVLRAQLEQHLANDAGFADTLRRLLDEVRSDQQAAQFLTHVSGGEVGKIINIGQANEVNID